MPSRAHLTKVNGLPKTRFKCRQMKIWLYFFKGIIRNASISLSLEIIPVHSSCFKKQCNMRWFS